MFTQLYTIHNVCCGGGEVGAAPLQLHVVYQSYNTVLNTHFVSLAGGSDWEFSVWHGDVTTYRYVVESEWLRSWSPLVSVCDPHEEITPSGCGWSALLWGGGRGGGHPCEPVLFPTSEECVPTTWNAGCGLIPLGRRSWMMMRSPRVWSWLWLWQAVGCLSCYMCWVPRG